MKKIVLALLLILAACSQQEGDVVKVGASLPLTGDVAFLGEGMVNGAKLAMQEMEDSQYKYQLILEDDHLNPREASTAATKLLNVDGVAMILSSTSGIGNVVSPLAREAGVIHMNAGASDATVAQGPYNFIHWTPPAKEAELWVKEVAERGHKRVAMIYLRQQGVFAVVDEIKQRIENTDIESVHESIFDSEERDFKTMILKAQESNPDLYFILSFSPSIDILYRQMLELGIEEPITSIEAYELSDDPSLFEGQWYVNAAGSSPEYREKYMEAYGKTPTILAPHGYDLMKMFILAYEKAGEDGKPSPEEIAEEILRLEDFNGAAGILTMSPEGIVVSNAELKTIRNGEPVRLS